MSKKVNGFAVGDFVSYPAHGVGRVKAIESQEIYGATTELFVIEFEKDKLTVSVPTSRAEAYGLRPLAGKDVVGQSYAVLKGKAKVKKAMWSRRAQEYEQKIHSGDIIAIAEVVRDLHRTDDQREQSYSERQLYEQAFERLTRELAAATEDTEEATGAKITEVLQSRAPAAPPAA